MPIARAGVSKRSRSEEHTSELQSRSDLVCRLLLEKKKKNRADYKHTGLNASKVQIWFRVCSGYVTNDRDASLAVGVGLMYLRARSLLRSIILYAVSRR